MPNVLDPIIPKLVARGLLALRQEARLARMVNRGYDMQAGDKGSTVTVPVPSAVPVTDVAPAATPPATGDTTVGEVSVTVDQWKEAAFHLNDKDMLQINASETFLPMQASEAIKGLANTVDGAIWAKYVDFYGFAGVPGTVPFATDTSEYTAARKELNKQLAPMDPRFVVLNPDAEANALGLRAFQDASFSGSIDGIVNGQINNKLGARWSMSQNAVRHTAGTGAGYLVNNGAGYAAGIKTVNVDTGTGTMVAGDIITFAGHTQTYVVVSAAGGPPHTSVTFEPGLKVTVADNVAITVKASHEVNLVFHRDAIALATRPFTGADPMGLGMFFAAVDPVSGLTLRLEVTREHKRTRWAYDILYGVKTTRRELGARIAG